LQGLRLNGVSIGNIFVLSNKINDFPEIDFPICSHLLSSFPNFFFGGIGKCSARGRAMTDTITTDDIDDAGRCCAMVLPGFAGDLPPYRCTRQATTLRNGRAVCAVHSRKLSIRYFDGGR
jgi:hypothetical protein